LASLTKQAISTVVANNMPFEWDIFLSYAREERAWVEQYLYQPMLAYHTADGRHPKIFFDVDEIAPGENWLMALEKAIKNSRKAVLVYSRNYFEKKMTKWELTKLVERDPIGEEGIINPLLIDIKCADAVPSMVSHINYVTHDTPDWFSRLCKALTLTPTVEKLCLQFADDVGNVTVQHTLPEVRVLIATTKGRRIDGAEIVVGCETDGLHGTLKIRAVDGIAVFKDLLFDKEQRLTRLTAWAEGCEPIVSTRFAVTAPVAIEPERVKTMVNGPIVAKAGSQTTMPKSTIPSQGNALFFAEDRAVAVFTTNTLGIYAWTGECRGEHAFSGQIRLVRRGKGMMVVADWYGKIHILRADGSHCCWDFADPARGFTIVGDIAIAGDSVYVGFCNGNLYRLVLNDPATPISVHEPGIQALAVVDDRLFLGGFDGRCFVLRNGNYIMNYLLEPNLWMLKGYSTHVVALGQERLYRIPIVSNEGMIPEPLHIAGVASVWTDGPCPIAVDEKGKGICTNAKLAQAAFQTVPEAMPVSADDSGNVCVFLNPDDSYSLLKHGRMVCTHRSGTLAVSPSADAFALGDDRGIRIVSAPEFEQSLARGGP